MAEEEEEEDRPEHYERSHNIAACPSLDQVALLFYVSRCLCFSQMFLFPWQVELYTLYTLTWGRGRRRRVVISKAREY